MQKFTGSIHYRRELPADVRTACTGIPAIDQAVRTLYACGYLHNHARLWLASYLVHWRKVHWRVGADWLYGHLLDGDLASNCLSWQWVAGTGSHKPYVFNAESLARFAPASWHSAGTVLDASYEAIDALARSPHEAATQTATHEARLPLPTCAEPLKHAQPLAELGFTAPSAQPVAGRSVWLVHPWALADLPSDLPVDTLCIAVVFAEHVQAHPWRAARWRFVGQRMAALAPHLWFGSAPEVAAALAGAKQVQTLAHACVPSLPRLANAPPISYRPAPRLFARLDTPMRSFSQWWSRVSGSSLDALLLAAQAQR